MSSQTPPADRFAEPAVRGALAQLQQRLGAQGGAGAPGSSGGSAAAEPGSIQRDLRQAAALLGLIPAQEALSVSESLAMAGPASVAVAAEALGLEATFQQRAPASISPRDCPCIVLLSGDRSRLVTASDGRGGLTVLADGAPVALRAAELAADAVGTLILLRQPAPSAELETRLAPGAEGSAASHASAAAGSQGGRAPRASPARVTAHVRQALAGSGPLMTQLIIASAIINLLGMFLPLFSMTVFDRVIPHAAFETLWALALGVLLALVLELALRGARLKLFDAAGQGVSHKLQGRVMSRLTGGRPADLPAQSGAAVQPLQDLDNMAYLAPQLAVSLMVDLPFFLVLMALIASIAGPIAFVPIIGTLLLVAVHILCHRLAHRHQDEHGGLQRRSQQLIIDSVSAQERIRVTGGGRGLLARWDMLSDAAGYAAHVSRYWHGWAAQASAVIVQAVIVGTLVWGVFRIDAAAMTIGALSAAMLLASRAMTPVSIATGLIFRALQLAQQSAPAAAILDAPLETGGDRRADGRDAILGQIDLRQVSLRHLGDSRQALKDVTLSIRPGERVGLIGKSGSGKSTLLRLLVRLVEAEQGAAQLDSRDIRHFDPEVLRKAVAYMPQDSALLDGSLEENLTMGLAGVSPPWFTQVARLTGAAEIAQVHPQGYSLRVGPGGTRLSGGERQIVSLARALMGRPRLLLLDEPTAALDNTAEARLIGELKGLPPEMGVIVATHRMQVLALVDRVIWIEGGRVVLDGPKAEVFQKLGLAA